MTLWLPLALMTAAAVFAVLWSLAGRAGDLRLGTDVAVYRDQLDEIERDRASGLIADPEAVAARVEVSRRLIAAADERASSTALGATTAWRRRTVALVALIGLPLGTLGLYLALGSPSLPDQPLARRLAAARGSQSVDGLIVQVESHLERNPDDARGWEVIAPIYARLGRFEDAVKARRNVLRLDGQTAEHEAALGEALVLAANGVVTAEAKSAFESAIGLVAGNPQARYFLGLAAEQDGNPSQAAAAWRALIADGPPDAPWMDFVRGALSRVERGAAPPAPTEEQVAAAAELAPDERIAMIRGMVARLSERLGRNGADVEGWLRLVRSYVVLGEPEKAKAAASEARRALASDPDKLRRLDELVKGLGLEG